MGGGHMRKNLSTITKIVITSIFLIGGTITANAGQWKENNNGWWYQNTDGSYPTDSWQWIDGKCYYFTPEGYCLINTNTPDGYQVGSDGAWVLNGVVQGKSGTDSKNYIQLSQESVANLTSLANIAYEAKNNPYHSDAFDVNINGENLSPEEKSLVLYWYQYHYENVDGRLSEDESSLDYELFHTVHPDDLRNMMKEILGDCNDNDMKVFERTYVEKKSNGLYYMNSMGDFGDAGSYYLSSESASYSMENGLLKITGNVVQYQDNGNEYGYLPVKTYTAYFVPNSSSYISGYQFNQLIVQ